MTEVTLVPLAPDDRNQFILDNQEAFNYGALREFGLQDDHFEEDGEIISRKTIEVSIDGGEAYRIIQNGQLVGGLVIKVNAKHGDLDLLFVSPRVHSKGIGYAAWCAVERLHPEVTVWETVTPYFEILWSSSTVIIRIPMIPMPVMKWIISSRMVCSALKRG